MARSNDCKNLSSFKFLRIKLTWIYFCPLDIKWRLVSLRVTKTIGVFLNFLFDNKIIFETRAHVSETITFVHSRNKCISIRLIVFLFFSYFRHYTVSYGIIDYYVCKHIVHNYKYYNIGCTESSVIIISLIFKPLKKKSICRTFEIKHSIRLEFDKHNNIFESTTIWYYWNNIVSCCLYWRDVGSLKFRKFSKK